ncbi:MAG: ABC transporter permease [Clostridium sp.]|uniref:ABC transporter permease n=1 Tax=Clostridium sp. TaxID=1506 RepID=UPI00290F38C7|nr:ABC transporter permease [Clostridium sp.]MDU7338270.1 ABC transporter permease [Clostridium sp.]
MLQTNGSEGTLTYTAAQNDLSMQKKKLAQEQLEIRLKKFTHNRASVFGLSVVLLVIVLAVFAPLIAMHDPLAMNTADRLMGMSAAHWFGTDNMGRDVFARVLYGARISLLVGFTVGLVSGFLGLVIGLYASTNKIADNVLMRICDGLKAIPSTLLAITMMAVLGADIKNVIISLTVVNIPNMARLARSQAMVVKEQTYIEAMRCLGSSQRRILWVHIVPNILSPMIVQMTFVFASAIITEAALSFLGAGVPAPAPSWGNILKEGKDVIYTAWWMILYPGIFTAMTVLGLNLLGDGIRDVLDPKSN